jgi:hypothetical protein
MVFISVRGSADPSAIVRPEGNRKRNRNNFLWLSINKEGKRAGTRQGVNIVTRL